MSESVKFPPFRVVLHEPRIPPNTGTVARTCVAVGAILHIVGKPVFRLDDTSLKRAGLDYWDKLRWGLFPDDAAYFAALDWNRSWMLTTKAEKTFSEIDYRPGDTLIFGSETTGLPESLRLAHPEQCLKLPMLPDSVRSLNLSNAVNVVIYEAWRQNNFYTPIQETNPPPRLPKS